jgi:hypothetical protein
VRLNPTWREADPGGVMRLFALLTVLLLGTQSSLCGLRGFGLSSVVAPGADPVAGLEAPVPMSSGHCAGSSAAQHGDDAGPTAPAPPGDPGCRRHCTLYLHSIPSAAPTPALPLTGAAQPLHAQAAGVHSAVAHRIPSRAPLLRAPPAGARLRLLHASLLI